MVDPLSDVLRVVRLTGAFFYRVEASTPWSVEALPARELAPHLLPGAQHVISYHIITSGRCVGGLMGQPLVELHAGDVIVFPHGDPHLMASDHGVRLPDDRFGVSAARYPDTVCLGDGPGGDTTFVCGFLGCDREPFNPLLASLPRQLHARGLREGRLAALAGQVLEESRGGQPGADSVLTRLAEVMFIEVLRHHARGVPPGQEGWLAGLADPIVGRALARLHAEPARPWTLEELAGEVAASRSSLAERFTRLVGQPPMQYLAAWRMQVAAGLLLQGSAKIATIAAAVGYDSEAAFSRAFKKATGTSPGAWRERRPGADAAAQEPALGVPGPPVPQP